jgi:Holliday junction resolvase RusA-like endonuclease
MLTLTNDGFYEFRIAIEPVPKARARSTRFGRHYTPQRTKNYETTLRQLFRVYWGSRPILLGPLDVSILFYIERPKTVKRQFPSVRGDIDNFLKSVLDAMNGTVLKDDGQIVRLLGEKLYSDRSAIVIRISTL